MKKKKNIGSNKGTHLQTQGTAIKDASADLLKISLLLKAAFASSGPKTSMEEAKLAFNKLSALKTA